jgi:SAM-dependent MidA family methyltransferase
LQVSSLFPRVFARLFLSMKQALGCDQFSLVELGCGDGEFLEGVLNELNAQKLGRGFRVWAVERSRPARDRLVKRLSRFDRCQVIESLDQVEWMGTLEGCIFSNELFDALPFDRYVARDGRWREIAVGLRDGALAETERDAPPGVQAALPSLTDGAIAPGHRIEYRSSIPSLYEAWGALLSRGYVVSVDYGHPRAVLLDPSRANGTAMSYRKHEADSNVLKNAGEQDITAHVDFTQLAQAGRAQGWLPEFFCSQGVLLSTVGEPVIAQFLAESQANDRPARAAAVKQLIHPSAMGEKFWTLLQAKDAPLPGALDGVSNRVKRLI